MLKILVVQSTATALLIAMIEVQRQLLLGGLVTPPSGRPRKASKPMFDTPSLCVVTPLHLPSSILFGSAVKWRVVGPPADGGGAQMAAAFKFSAGIRMYMVTLRAKHTNVSEISTGHPVQVLCFL